VRTLQPTVYKQRAELGVTKQKIRKLGKPVYRAYQC